MHQRPCSKLSRAAMEGCWARSRAVPAHTGIVGAWVSRFCSADASGNFLVWPCGLFHHLLCHFHIYIFAAQDTPTLGIKTLSGREVARDELQVP